MMSEEYMLDNTWNLKAFDSTWQMGLVCGNRIAVRPIRGTWCCLTFPDWIEFNISFQLNYVHDK